MSWRGRVLTIPLLRVAAQGWRVGMEDAMTVRLSLSKRHPDISLFGVYDGHAGHRCAAYLEDAVPRVLGELRDPTSVDELEDSMMRLDEEFLKRPDQRENGSTCVIALVRPLAARGGDDEKANSEGCDGGSSKEPKRRYELTVSNVGDSKAILISGDGTTVTRLTRDHKPSSPEEKTRIEAAGGTVKNDRVDGQLALARAIGDWNYKNDEKKKPLSQKVVPKPDVTRAVADEGDILLLCCDGLYERLDDSSLSQFVHSDLKRSKFADPALTLARLLDLSLERGSKDNMTAIVVCFRDGKNYSSGPQAAGKQGFIAGPFHEFKAKERFRAAYTSFAQARGYSEEKLSQLIPKLFEDKKSATSRSFESVLSGLEGQHKELLLSFMSPSPKHSSKRGVSDPEAMPAGGPLCASPK